MVKINRNNNINNNKEITINTKRITFVIVKSNSHPHDRIHNMTFTNIKILLPHIIIIYIHTYLNVLKKKKKS